MPADVHLDPDGLRRAAVTARRIADGLDAADPGPPAEAPTAAGVGVEHVRERLRESMRRARDELAALAAEASAAATRAEEADRAVAASLRALDPPGGPGCRVRSPAGGDRAG